MKVNNIENLKGIISATESAFYLLNNEIESDKEVKIWAAYSPKMNALVVNFEWVSGYNPVADPNPNEKIWSEQKIYIPYDCPVHKVVKDIIDILEIIDNDDIEKVYELDTFDELRD